MNINPEYTNGLRGDALALLGGLLLPFAFAPYGIAPLAILSLGLLYATWLQETPGRAFRRGWLFGLGMFGVGISWVNISMTLFGGMPPALSMGLTTVFVMFLALFPALAGFLVRRFFKGLRDNPAAQLLLLMPAAWMLLEWVRSWIFTGFPWLSLGYSQIDTPLAGWAPLFGVFALSLFTAITAGALVYLFITRKTGIKLALPLLLAFWVLPLALAQIQWSTPVGKPMTVAMIQGNISQDKKWLPEQRIPTLDLYANLSRENWGKDLIIWPETAVPAFFHQIKPFLHAVAQEARMNGSELLVGLPVMDLNQEQYFNSMVNLGGTEKVYAKRHLVPFGEYLPIKSALAGVIDFLQIPMSNFTPGNDEEPPILRLAGQPAGISICYEDVFGEEVNRALPDATLLVNASNDAWFGDSKAPHQHLEIARMRSLETARYMLRSTNTGVSAIIGPDGKVVAISPQFKTHVLTGEIQPLSGMTPFAIFGNIPAIMAMVVMIVVGALVSYYRSKRSDA